MEEYAERLSGKECFEGAGLLKFNDMHPDISGMKYNELLYNPLIESPWAHVRKGESLTLWLIPK